MYTFIDTAHALREIPKYLKRNNGNPSKATTHELAAVTEALTIVMTHNIFQFGDTYWLQLNGTAMGVSPSCDYATIYFAIREREILHRYPELLLYRRFIDDIFFIWIPKTIDDDIRFQSFQNDVNNYGKLKWKFSQIQRTINFLENCSNEICNQSHYIPKMFIIKTHCWKCQPTSMVDKPGDDA